MSQSLKRLMACFLMIISFAMGKPAAIAQAGFGFQDLSEFRSFSNNTEYPGSGESDILIDDFEYCDSYFCDPIYNYDHEWTGDFLPSSILDLSHGSHVLDVHRPSSVFILSSLYSKHKLFHSLSTPPSSDAESSLNYINLKTHKVLSFDLKASILDAELPEDIFEFFVEGFTDANYDVIVKIIPNDVSSNISTEDQNTYIGLHGYSATVSNFYLDSFLEITVFIGKESLDDSWHVIWINLYNLVRGAVDKYDEILTKSDWYMTKATRIILTGSRFRLDNIVFRVIGDLEAFLTPNLFEMGPLYAQIFEPYRYLFIADYEVDEGNIKVTDLMLNPNNFLLVQDPNDPNDPVIKYWTNLGADSNLFGENDPNIAELFDKDSFVVDLDLPIFADQNLRFNGSAAQTIINQGILAWYSTIEGYSSQGVPGFLLHPLIIYPYDGMPTYLPTHYSVIEVIKTYGKPYYSPEHVYMLEGALWNSGITVWPNIAHLDFTPQYIEDLTIYIKVTNGVHSDFSTCSISVVNYPVENYPPVHQLPIEDLIFFVDEVGEYQINFIDPDCFIFSLSEAPPSSHILGYPVNENFRTDMDDLTWSITTVDGVSLLVSWSTYITDSSIGLNSWDYGYFQCTGLLRLQPEYEKIFDMVVACQDDRGGIDFTKLKIIFTSRSDTDGDNIYDFLDNCPNIQNTDQMDTDQDDLGDACDPCPLDPNNDDADGDGICAGEGDCNDHNDTIYPGAPELCDGRDNDCDGIIPSNEVDSDSDGFLACNDCDDQDSTVYQDAPGTHEGKDNNCNGVIDKDEKKRTSQSIFYPNYMPILFPWLQPFQYSNLDYQLPLTASWSPIQYPIYKQQPWYSGYRSPFYTSLYMQSVFQYVQFPFQYSQPYWSQSYMMPWDVINNQLL